MLRVVSKSFLPAAILALLCTGAYAQNTAVFPQVAFGGPFTTFVSIANATGIPAQNVRIQFFDDNGAPLAANIDGGAAAATVTFNLPELGEKVIQLTGDAVKAGWGSSLTQIQAN